MALRPNMANCGTKTQNVGQNPLGQNPLGQNLLGQNRLGQTPPGQNPLTFLHG